MDTTTNRGKSSWPAALLLAAALMLITLATFQSLEGNRTQREAQTVIGTINQQDISYRQYLDEIRLQALRQDLRNQGDLPVNQAAILNRLIINTLFLQAAQQTGMEVPDTGVQAAIDDFYDSFNLSPSDFQAILETHKLSYETFETSIRNFLQIVLFAEVDILSNIPSGGRQIALENWLAARFEASIIDFDPTFIEFISQNQLQ